MNEHFPSTNQNERPPLTQVEELRSRFPQATILYANELPDYIKKEEAEK